MLTNLLAILELAAAAFLGAVIVLDLVSTAKRRLSPIKIPIRNNRRRR
jgi:hypothetical protein